MRVSAQASYVLITRCASETPSLGLFLLVALVTIPSCYLFPHEGLPRREPEKAKGNFHLI